MLSTYFGKDYFYIDSLCSKSPGAGKILTLHAFEFAFRKKQKGIIAFSFTLEENKTPASLNMFLKLKFEKVFENGPQSLFTKPTDSNTAARVESHDDDDDDDDGEDDDGGEDGVVLDETYGYWVVAEDKLGGLNFKMLDLCTRNGLTGNTKNNLIWRCPG